MRNEQGSITRGMAIVGAVIFFALMVGCVAVAADENAMTPSPAGHRQEQGDEDRSDGKNSRGKCENAGACDDRDFSPTFDESPVIICLPESSCHFGEGETAAMMPPNPGALMAAIATFTEGVGTAAGALAGAIAGGTIGILLGDMT